MTCVALQKFELLLRQLWSVRVLLAFLGHQSDQSSKALLISALLFLPLH